MVLQITASTIPCTLFPGPSRRKLPYLRQSLTPGAAYALRSRRSHAPHRGAWSPCTWRKSSLPMPEPSLPAPS